jgi:hypothetical protein
MAADSGPSYWELDRFEHNQGAKKKEVIPFGNDGSSYIEFKMNASGQLEVVGVSLVPGTGADDLGKAIDSVVGSTDTGIAMLGKHLEDQVHRTTAEGDYDILSMDSLGSMHVNAEAHHIFDNMDATTGWAAANDDTENLATTAKHVLGTAALSFDKADGTANTTFACIEKTLSSVDLGEVSPHDILQTVCYLSSIDDVSYVFLRVGTDASNYNEWRIPGDSLTAGEFEALAFSLGDASHDGIAGNGWDETNILYLSVGVAFSAETDTLTGIIFDQVSYHTNQHTTTSLGAEVTSSIGAPNVKVTGWTGSVSRGAGNSVNNNTLRVVNATDDVNLAAAKVSLEIMDAAVDVEGAALASGVLLQGDDGTDRKNINVDPTTGDVQVDVTEMPVIRTLNTPLTALEIDYDTTSTETATSDDTDCSPYRMATLSFTLSKTGTPTGVFQINVEVSNDGTNFVVLKNGMLGSWVYSAAAVGGGISRALIFPIASAKIRVRMDGAGLLNGTNEYAITNCDLYLRE